MMFAGLAFLSSCSDDITPENNYEPDNLTWFRSGDEPTANAPKKIVVNYDRVFYWQPNDRIWVQPDGEESWVHNISSELVTSGKDSLRNGSFGFDSQYSFSQPTYVIRYTGKVNDNNANGQSSHQVAIQHHQYQSSPNNSYHISTDGDCGTAVASKREDGSFKFDIIHKSHILVLTPRTVGRGNTNPKASYIKRIKISDLDGDTLAGIFGFDDNGLILEDAHNVQSEVILHTNTPGAFTNNSNKVVANNACYIVIRPGKHRLKVEYTIGFGKKVTISESAPYTYTLGEEMDTTVTKYLPPTGGSYDDAPANEYAFNPNDITRVTHKIEIYKGAEFGFEIPYAYYQWDARAWLFCQDNGMGTEIGEKKYKNGLGATYATLGAETWWRGYIKDEWKNIEGKHWYWKWRSFRYGAEQGMYSCNAEAGSGDDADKQRVQLPNANEMTWYIFNGDPYYDPNTEWALQDYHGGADAYLDGTAIFRGGLWFKKRQYIVGWDSEHPMSRNGKLDYDLRTTFPSEIKNSSPTLFRANTVKTGRPSDEVISQYFYVPLMGCFVVNDRDEDKNKVTYAQYKYLGARAYYWTSTPYIYDTSETDPEKYRTAYYLYFDKQWMNLSLRVLGPDNNRPNSRWHGMVANKRPENYWVGQTLENWQSMQWFQ